MLELTSTDDKQTFVDPEAIVCIQQQEGYTVIVLGNGGCTVEVKEAASDIKRERDEFFDA